MVVFIQVMVFPNVVYFQLLQNKHIEVWYSTHVVYVSKYTHPVRNIYIQRFVAPVVPDAGMPRYLGNL